RRRGRRLPRLLLRAGGEAGVPGQILAQGEPGLQAAALAGVPGAALARLQALRAPRLWQELEGR
ncbi:unnamed protein product, partial [Prorocentrum cordatum]